MTAAISQREKKARGHAFEEIVKEELRKQGCDIVHHYVGVHEEGLSDVWAICDNELMVVECKETLAYHKDGDRIRSGRFVLGEKAYEKDCYAFGIDDQVDDVLTIDFITPKDPDRYIRRHGKRPKYPIERLKRIRDQERCFLEVGTIVRPRQDLVEKMQKYNGFGGGY
jgi:hypothetical protein